MFAEAVVRSMSRVHAVLAQAPVVPSISESPLDMLFRHVIAVVVFSVIGIIVFAIGVWLFVRLCPFSVRKEIEEDQNTALGIIMGSVLLGVSIIIAAAILG